MNVPKKLIGEILRLSASTGVGKSGHKITEGLLLTY